MDILAKPGSASENSRVGHRCLERLFGLAIATLLAWAFAPGSSAQETAPKQAPSEVEVKIQAQPLTATVGDPIRLDFDFALPKGYRLQFPQLPGQIGEFVILESYPGPDLPATLSPGNTAAPVNAPPAAQEGGVFHHRVRLVVAVYKTGEFEFPSLECQAIDPEGKPVPAASPAVKIRIESVLTEKDPSLRDLKKQADIEEPFNWILWSALAALGSAAVLLIWWLLKRKRPPIGSPSPLPEQDPLDAAEAELRNLVARKLPEKGLVKQFYVVLSEIVKKGLEAGYGIQTVEKTTSEIIAELTQAPAAKFIQPNPASLTRIETVLLSSDMVKFARYLPSSAEHDEALRQAFLILADCRASRQRAIPGAAAVAGVP